MQWTISISASAKADIIEIKKWYSQQSIIASKNFIEEVIATIETLRNENKENKTVYGSYKRLLLKKFPYVIYYIRQPQSQVTQIIAILHNKRNRTFIFKRLQE